MDFVTAYRQLMVMGLGAGVSYKKWDSEIFGF